MLKMIRLFVEYMRSKIVHNVNIRNGLLFTVFAFINKGIGFLLLFVVAFLITPEGYGKLNLFTTLITILTIFLTLNTSGVLSVEYFNSTPNRFSRILNSVLLITISIFLLGIATILFFSKFIESSVGITVTYQWLALLICFLQVFSNINQDIWRLEEKPVMYGLYSVGVIISNLGLTLFFIMVLHYGWEGRVLAQLIVGVVFFIVSIIFLVKRKYLKALFPNKKTIMTSLYYGLPLVPHSVSHWAKQGFDRYIINYFYSVYNVGVFSFVYNFSNIIVIVGNAFNASNSVYIYKNLAKDPKKVRAHLWKQTKLMIVFFVVFSLLVCIGAAIFIPIAIPKYSESVIYLFPLCMAGMFQCIYYLFTNYLFFFKKTKQLMYITFWCSLAHIALSVALTRYSIIYTAYIALFSNAMYALTVFLYSQKVYKLRG